MKTKRSVKIEIEITYEYDEKQLGFGSDTGMADAYAIDMALEAIPDNIQDGVRLLEVCNRDTGAVWFHREER